MSKRSSLKNVITLIWVFLIGIPIMRAQVRFGAKAGLNISNISQVHANSESRYGFQAGGLALFPLRWRGRQFFLQTEIVYSQQGERNGATVDFPEEEYFLQYVNIPILFKAYLNHDSNQFFAEIGPLFGYKVGESFDLREDSEGDNEVYKSFDFAWNVGIGYSFNRRIEVNARYTYGLVDVIEQDLINEINRTSVFQLGISYIITSER